MEAEDGFDLKVKKYHTQDLMTDQIWRLREKNRVLFPETEVQEEEWAQGDDQ